MAVLGTWQQLAELDQRAAALARSAGALRLLLGEALARIDSQNAHHSFGFSSLGAYATERCHRGVTWTREAVRRAREVEGFPELRSLVLAGRVTWSALGWVLRALRPYLAARAALAEGMLQQAERLWIERAERLTVRELAALVRAAVPRGAEAQQTSSLVGTRGVEKETARRTHAAQTEFAVVHSFLRRLPTHVLTLTVQADTAWWLECARNVYERSVSDCPGAACSTESFMLALLAEARTALEGEAPLDEDVIERWGIYVELLEGWRAESERRCDAQRPALPLVGAEVESSAGNRDSARPAEPDQSAGNLDSAKPAELDQIVRRLAVALGQRDMELGLLADWLLRADAWRRLGFASEAHYVRERMGSSFSQWKSRRALARKLANFPSLRRALLAGDLGLEAAVVLLRVVKDEESERLWLGRARERTFKHLREEIRVAELGFQQLGRTALPPSEDAMRRALALEGRVKSGVVLLEEADTAQQQEVGPAERDASPTARDASLTARDAGRMSAAEDSEPAPTERGISVVRRMSVASRAWLDLRGELWEVFQGAFLGGPGEPDVRREPEPCPSSLGAQKVPSPGRHRRGQVRLRLRLERDTLLEFRALERLFRRRHRGDFFEFLCRHFLAVWAPAMLTDVKYAHVYRRDAFRCSSPVCSRQDVQPHHLRFRSQGGGEEDENLTALCTWCHLEGVHGGRLRVHPPASAMHWQIGAVQPFEVRGRRKVTPPARKPALVTDRKLAGEADPGTRGATACIQGLSPTPRTLQRVHTGLSEARG